MTLILERLERALPLIAEKEALHVRLKEVNASLERLEEGESIASKSVTKKAQASGKSKRRGKLQAMVIEALRLAGAKGLKVSQIVDETGVPIASLRVWIYTRGKKVVKKISPGVFALKG